MYVCMSARISQKQTRANFIKFSVHVTLGHSSIFLGFSDGSSTIRYVLQVSWMTSCFHITERMGHNQRRRLCYVVRQVVVSGATFAISGRILYLTCIVLRNELMCCTGSSFSFPPQLDGGNVFIRIGVISRGTGRGSGPPLYKYTSSVDPHFSDQ